MAKRIVILGGGFAGIFCARRLEKKLRPGEAEITLISRDNYTLFTPMLPEVSSGGIETRHVVTPVRAQLRRTRFVLGEITNIDLDGCTVDAIHPITGDVTHVAYDHVVFALGSVTSTFGIPGVAEKSLPLKSLEDAEVLRNRIIAALEQAAVTADPVVRARLLTFVIVGGGYTGCEAAGELVDLFHSIVPYYAPLALTDVRLAVVEAGSALLADLPAAMGRYTTKHLQRRNVELILGDGVKELDDRGLTLQSGRRVDAATVVWSAGVRPSPVMRGLPCTHARNGALIVERDFSVADRPGVWALGDCAWIPRVAQAQQDDRGAWYPMTAQHAIREGPALADNLVAVLRGRPTKPFVFTSLGTMASLGGRRGVAALPNDIVITGFVAWFLWRSYYLARLPGADRRARVAFDWTLDLIFRRDIAELRLFTDTVRKRAEPVLSPEGRSPLGGGRA